MRGGHLAILQRGFGVTKESQVAAGGRWPRRTVVRIEVDCGGRQDGNQVLSTVTDATDDRADATGRVWVRGGAVFYYATAIHHVVRIRAR